MIQYKIFVRYHLFYKKTYITLGDKMKLGLSLSGGGVKGAAHIGVVVS